MSNTTEPAYDVTARHCLILELPELCDEAAWQLSELLQSLAEHIDALYSVQISRARQAHEHEREQLYRERLLAEAQQQLPLPDPPF